MDYSSNVIIVLLGLFVWGAIIYMIIRSANDTTKRDKIQLQNQKLLALIAEKMGANIDDIKKVLIS